MLSDYVGPVVDLLDPYGEGLHRTVQWMEEHPGRWALIQDSGLGLDYKALWKRGYQISTSEGKTYARKKHPEGESLKEALRRDRKAPKDLPVLGKSEFNWTPEELKEATEVALANLFPVAEPGARRRR